MAGVGCTLDSFFVKLKGIIFSVTRRSRSDVNHSLTEWTLADLTDVTLVTNEKPF